MNDGLARESTCQRRGERGAHVERLAMSGDGLSRLFEAQPYYYPFVSCSNCRYTEVFDLRLLEGKGDSGTFLEVLFAD